MAKAKTVKKKVRKPGTAARAKAAAARSSRTRDPLVAPVKGTTRHDLGGVRLDVARAGAARVKRTIYPIGFRWSADMKPVIGTERCMHAHVGFLARGEIHIEYPDGCAVEYRAPAVVAIEPGHDGWVVGKERAVLIEFDFAGDTVDRLGMPGAHRHS
jgi:hypothetical protein